MWAHTCLLVTASLVLAPLTFSTPLARADESTCAAIDRMADVVNAPENNGPILTEALMYLRGDNPAYSALDRQFAAISDARDIFGRDAEAVQANLAEVTDPVVHEQLTMFSEGLAGAYNLSNEWLANVNGAHDDPEFIDDATLANSMLWDGMNRFHIQSNICNGGVR